MKDSVWLPPEWHPQAAVMLTWPRRDGDFARWFEAVEDNFVALVAAIARFEPVIVACADPAAVGARLQAAGVPLERVRRFACDSDDVWARDHGPITVLGSGDGAPRLLDFRFNGWGGKFEHANDDRITGCLHAQGAFGDAALQDVPLVLEGGAIDCDGLGTLLTTARCLLAPTRNPRLDRAAIEAQLKMLLGLSRILWLEHGDLLGDDTDGHIDTLARFCDARTIAYQGCADPADPHYAGLAAMRDELAALRTASGEPYRLVELPLPAPLHDHTGRRLPAGYANFLIVNGAVLVPTYGDAAGDAEALARLRGCFRDRDVVGVDCRALIHQYGSLHCVTMQLPQPGRPAP